MRNCLKLTKELFHCVKLHQPCKTKATSVRLIVDYNNGDFSAFGNSDHEDAIKLNALEFNFKSLRDN